MRSRITPGDGDLRHGTWNGYANLCCRCPQCTAAQRIYLEERRHADRPIPVSAHGRGVGYSYYGCRCEQCSAFMRDYNKQYRARRKAAS